MLRPREGIAPASLPEPGESGLLLWTWFYGQTANQVQDLLGADNRLVSVQVRQAAPLLLDVALVRNTGPARKTWWWVPGAGPDLAGGPLGEYCGFREGRIVSLAPYVINGTTYFAAVLIGNAGSDYKAWWWYFDTPASNINGLLSQNNARLVDLRSYSKNATTGYALVMIPNTGADESGSWWYTGVSASVVRAKLKDNNAFLASIQGADLTGATFDVIMNARATSTMPVSQGVSWVWATNDTD